MKSSPDEPSSRLAQILADVIMSEIQRSPTDDLLQQVSNMREGLFQVAAVDYPRMEAMMDELLVPGNICGDKNCTSCNVATSEIRKQVALMRKIIEPHKPEVLEMFKRAKRIFDALTKLHQGINYAPGRGTNN